MKKQEISVNKDGAFAYRIYFENSYDKLGPALKEALEGESRRICIVTDSNVEPLYAETVKKELAHACKKVCIFTFPAGEANKTLDTVKELYTFLIQEKFDRKDLLAALGGGVTGDLTGYAAATYLRGIDFIQLPTTLLAQVDSSIGGKTGVDFDQYKNMVGAFHQPKMVYMNMATLATLNDEQFSCGMGEILKHGLIRDSAYYGWTISHMSHIQERDPSTLLAMVMKSCEIKRKVVEADPYERGERALLNFGHTIGHAIEKLKIFELLHGQCVALGYIAAAYISWKRELLTTEDFFEIRDMNVGFDLPIYFDGLENNAILEATTLDKKMEAGQIKFVLLKKIGEAIMDKTVTHEEMLAAIDYINRDTGEEYE